jgi:hypothetical protein
MVVYHSNSSPITYISPLYVLRFELEWDTPILYIGTIEMVLTGPQGTQWTLDADNTIELLTDDVENEGYGTWEYEITTSGFVRSTTLTITRHIEYTGRRMLMETQIDKIGPGESDVISVGLKGFSKGINNLTYSFEATAIHEHSGSGVDEEVYYSDGTYSILVGDDLEYSKPDEVTTVSTSLWIMGRVLGFITVALFIASFISGGSITRIRDWIDERMETRVQWHCVISFSTIIAVILHLLVLYLGYYSNTFKGLISGGIPLLLMILVGITGWKRKLIVQKTSEKTWRRLHLWLSIIAVLLIVLHAIFEGTDLAFLRWW